MRPPRRGGRPSLLAAVAVLVFQPSLHAQVPPAVEAADEIIDQVLGSTGRPAARPRGRRAQPSVQAAQPWQRLLATGQAGAAAIDGRLRQLWQQCNPDPSAEFQAACRLLVPLLYRIPVHGAEVFRAWTRHPDDTFRLHVVAGLGGLTQQGVAFDAQQAPPLLAFLGDPDPAVRRQLLSHLGNAPPERIAPMIGDPDDGVAAAALEWLAGHASGAAFDIPPVALVELRKRLREPMAETIGIALAGVVRQGILLGSEQGQLLHLDALPFVRATEIGYPENDRFVRPGSPPAWLEHLAEAGRRFGRVGNQPTAQQIALTSLLDATLPFVEGDEMRASLFELLELGHGQLLSRGPLLGVAIGEIDAAEMVWLAERLNLTRHEWLLHAMLAEPDLPPSAAPIFEMLSQQNWVSNREAYVRAAEAARGSGTAHGSLLQKVMIHQLRPEDVADIAHGALLRAVAMTPSRRLLLPVLAAWTPSEAIDGSDLAFATRALLRDPHAWQHLTELDVEWTLGITGFDALRAIHGISPAFVDEAVAATRRWCSHPRVDAIQPFDHRGFAAVLALARDHEHPEYTALMTDALRCTLRSARLEAMQHGCLSGLPADPEVRAAALQCLDGASDPHLKLLSCVALREEQPETVRVQLERLATSQPELVLTAWPAVSDMLPESTLGRWMLEGGNHVVRVAACTAAERQGDPAAIPLLLRAMGDANEDVRKAARTAIENLRFRAETEAWMEKRD